MLQRFAKLALGCSGDWTCGWASSRAPLRCAAVALATLSPLLAAAQNAEPTPAAPAEPAAAEAAAPAAPAGVAAPAPPPDPAAALIALGRDLELLITETGPDQPWTLHLHNRGGMPIGVMADPGLLWFEVSLPSSSTTVTCRLPEPLWPKAMRRRAELVLPPGERFSRRF